ncbi:MAG: FtsX-like permease family protein [Planctomycetota bacterium]|nr:FtsX-like permease family protein [Planctomycetota bacterium]
MSASVVHRLASRSRMSLAAWGLWALSLAAAAWGGQAELNLDPAQFEADRVPLEAVKEHVRFLESLGTRMPGAAGHTRARQYVINQLKAFGYSDATGSDAPKFDDCLAPRKLEAGVAGEEGLRWTPERPDSAFGRALRLRLADADDSLHGGSVEISGRGADGKPLAETLILPPSRRGEAQALGLLRFTKVDSIALQRLGGNLSGNETFSAGWDAPPFHSDDCLGLKDLAAGGEGERWTPEHPEASEARNVRILVRDADDSLKGGEIEVAGFGPDGKEQAETLTLPPSLRGEAEVAGDKRFTRIESIALKSLSGTRTEGDALSAGWGVRYFVGIQRFWGSAPVQEAPGALRFEGAPPEGFAAEYPLYALWPNGTAPTTTGPQGVSGALVYGRSGRLGDFDKLPVKDALVLLDLNEDTAWTFAASLGARAVIFIEPKDVLNPVLDRQMVRSPVEFPRLWIPRDEGLKLKAALAKAGEAGKTPAARAICQSRWKTEQWDNIFLLVPGKGAPASVSDEEKRKEIAGSTVVLAAYYDSCSMVPSLAPGAEQALSCATLLELARRYREDPPARDVLLLFATGHFQGLKGEREFFADVDRLPLPVDRGALALHRGEGTISRAILDRALAAPGLALDHDHLLKLTREAIEAYKQTPLAALDRSYVEAATSHVSFSGVLAGLLFLVLAGAWLVNRGQLRALGAAVLLGLGLSALLFAGAQALSGREASGLALYLGVQFLVLALLWYLSRGGARYLGGAFLSVTGMTVLLYAAAVPWLTAHFKSSQGIVDEDERLDGFLDLWKQELNTREAELERQARMLRYEGQKGSAEQEALLKEQKAHEEAGQLLYSLSSSGFGIRPEVPVDPAARERALRETAALFKNRLADQLEWVEQEFARLERNKPFRDLVAERLHRDADAKGRKSLFLSLDLSSGNRGVAMFYMGNLFGTYGDIESRYKNFGRSVMTLAKAVETAAGAKKEGTLMPDTLLESGRRSWATYQGARLAVASEVAVQAQMRGLTFATPFDRRMKWDTPQDLVDGPQPVAWDKVDTQLRVLGPFLKLFLAEPAVTAESRFDKGLKNTGYSQLVLKTVRRGGSRSIFPDIPVPGVMLHRVWHEFSAGGVRLCLMESTNPLGKAQMTGMRRGWRYQFEAEKSDPETGEIVYSINKARHGLNENQIFQSQIALATRQDTVELFRAQGLTILDIVDPGRLTVLRNCSLLAGQTESKPLEFGTTFNYWNEPHRVLFAEPGSRIKVLFREGEFGLRVAILDVDEAVAAKLMDAGEAREVKLDEARGPGFRLGTRKVLDWLPLRTAGDLWCLGEKRLQNLRAHSIGNAKLDNPEFPGPYSVGTVTAAKNSAEVVGEGVEQDEATGRGWDENVVGLPLVVGGSPEAYRVERFVAPNKLILDRPFQYDVPPRSAYTLTKQDPGLHNLTRMRLKEAQEARANRDYGEAWRLANEAWGLESRAYPEVLGTANDSVMGVVFYLFLLLPFCFFIERLTFAFPKIEHQIGAFFSIFVFMFGVLWMVHPAFDLVAAPPVILLAFVIMSLAGIVIAIVYGKFNAEMRMMQQGVQGAQSADVNRASAAMVAVSLGISQMRRRQVRTFLTCTTIVLLTFTALSFTSTVRTMSQAHIDLSPGDEKDARYQGILLRQLNYDALSTDAYEQMQRELAVEGLSCTPRFWRVAKKGEKIFIDVLEESPDSGAANLNERMVSPACMVGFSEREKNLFPELAKPVAEGGMIAAGSWLEEGDANVCLIPSTLIENLRPKGIAKEDWNAERTVGLEVLIGSHKVKVKGVFVPEEFDSLRDIDDEPLTPADFSASEASRGAEQQTDQTAEVTDLENAKATKYEHINAGNTLILPWQTARLLGADLRSVATRIGEPGVKPDLARLDYMVSRLLKRIEKNLFVGRDGRRRLYASTGKLSLSGLGNLLVPLLISVLILLNTMIGAVYERNREITIFSALGLAPSHIAALFLAEAVVYATLGAILGYLLGQGTAKFVQAFGEQLGIAGLYLNYSSSSAVFVTAIVMIAVVGSTIYPSIMAARAAAPSEERRWSVPAPVGDEISIELPFSFQRELVPGAALFLHEFFESHAESSLGKFTAKEVTLETFHTENGQGLCIFFMAWLTPYDLGVSQEVQIYIVPTEDEGLYVTEATFYRVSGYVASWRRVNLPFLNALRKHLLIWRTYSPEQRMEYSLRGFYQFSEAFEAVGWPAPQGGRLPKGAEAAELPEEGAVLGPWQEGAPEKNPAAAEGADGGANEPAKA